MRMTDVLTILGNSVCHRQQPAHRKGWMGLLERQELAVPPHFDVTVTSFEMAEINLLVTEKSRCTKCKQCFHAQVDI